MTRLDTSITLVDQERGIIAGCVMPFGVRMINGPYIDAETEIRFTVDPLPVVYVDPASYEARPAGRALRTWADERGLWAEIEIDRAQPDAVDALAFAQGGELYFCNGQRRRWYYKAAKHPLDGYKRAVEIDSLRLTMYPHYIPAELTAEDYLMGLRAEERAAPPEWIPELSERPVRRPGDPLPPGDLASARLDSKPSVNDIPPQMVGVTAGNAIARFDGSELVPWSSSHAFYLTQFLYGNGRPKDITPSDLGSYAIKQCVVDPFAAALRTAIGCYLLASDGTNSAAWYDTNIAGTLTDWAKGADVADVYTVLRGTKTPGTISMYTPASSSGGSTCSATADFNSTNFPVGWRTDPGYAAIGTWSGTTLESANGGANGYYASVYGTIPTTGIDSVEFDINNDIPSDYIHMWLYSGATVYGPLSLESGSGAGWVHRTVSVGPYSNIDAIQIFIAGCAGGGTPPGDCIQMRDFQYCDSGGGIGGNAACRTSTDYGATFATAESLSGTPGAVGGFDIQAAGNNTFGAGNGTVERATTLGGAFSSYYSITGGAQARCIIVPWFNWAGASQITATNPNIIVALNTPDGSSRTLLWIEGGATPGTVHDITPAANLVFANPNCVTDLYGHHIMVFGKISGVEKCYRSTDKGTTWAAVTGRTAQTFIRCRRYDRHGSTSGSDAGQVYLCDNGAIGYSSKWGSAGLVSKLMPASGIVGFDTVV